MPPGKTVQIVVSLSRVPDTFAESDDVPLDRRFHNAVVEWMLNRAFSKDQDSAADDAASAAHLRHFYEILGWSQRRTSATTARAVRTVMSPIARVELRAFLPFVMAACPDAPENLAVAYVRQAAIDFCQRSGVLWRTAFIDQQANVSAYPVWPEPCETVVRVNAVCVDGCCYRGCRASCCFDHCGARYTIDDGLLCIAITPEVDRSASIEVRFAAAPARDACEVDAVSMDDWQEAVEDGALARLHLLPKYAFSSQTLAGIRSRSFADSVRRARVAALKSDTGGPMRAWASEFV